MMSCDGGNDYKQAHNGRERRKRETGSAILVAIGIELVTIFFKI